MSSDIRQRIGTAGMVRRREFVGGMGTAVVCAGSGLGFGQPASDAGDAAYSPWKTWRQENGDKPVVLVRAAILAANAFNAQPWLFKVADTRIQLYADLKRNLGFFDPYRRELHLSLGCALENLVLAASANGYVASLTFPPGELHLAPTGIEPTMVSQIDLSPGKSVYSALYEAIPRRRTNRTPYDPTVPLLPDFHAALGSLTTGEPLVKMFLLADVASRERLAEIAETANKTNLADPDVRRGVQPWLRTTKEQMDTFRDGELIELAAGPTIPYRDLLLTAPLFGIIAVRDRYNREQALRAGRIWQRAHLLATAMGIAARVDNSPNERIDHERRLALEPRCAAQIAELTKDPQWQSTLMFSMGYATATVPATARRPIEDVEL